MERGQGMWLLVNRKCYEVKFNRIVPSFTSNKYPVEEHFAINN